jgi:hypothetical protein
MKEGLSYRLGQAMWSEIVIFGLSIVLVLDRLMEVY